LGDRKKRRRTQGKKIKKVDWEKKRGDEKNEMLSLAEESIKGVKAKGGRHNQKTLCVHPKKG